MPVLKILKRHGISVAILMACSIASVPLWANTPQQKPLSPEEIRLQQQAKKFKDFIPDQYFLFDAVEGDLNQDGQKDAVLIVKKIDPKGWVNHPDQGKLDRNRRGILVLLQNQFKYQKLMQNLTAFSSENEEGGVYFPPELSVDIRKNILGIHYGHGRYGYWSYKFRLEQQDMRLIGYDLSSNHGPYTDYRVSINFLSKQKKHSQNMNLADRDLQEKFKHTWSKVNYSPIYLSKIKDFDELNFE